MKQHKSAAYAAVLLTLCIAPACAAATARLTLNLNRDWKFSLGDHPDAQEPTYDDRGWDSIGLPHTFSLPYFRSAAFYIGYGWYRKHFSAQPDWRGKRVSLELDGAFQDAEIYVNGTRLGEHRGGYTGFMFDITPALKPGDNVIAVRLNNNWNPQLQPRAGEHEFCGGLYREVRLVVTDPLHIAWYGTFVTTPHVSADWANVRVKTEVKNDGRQLRRCTLVTTVIDPDGRAVTEMRSTEDVPPSATVTFNQTSNQIQGPKLWHPDHPFLYTVQTKVLEGKTIVDETLSPLGFRWFRWTAEDGFFLNGQRYYLRGANVHQDHAGWGIAVTHAGMYRDVKLTKDAGFNFIRGSHYPHDPAFADACDRLGMILWSENPFWGKGGFGADGYWNASAYPIREQDFAPFEESAKQQLREMIRILRNHPSILFWSMTNEAFFTENLDRAKNLVRELVAVSHREDPTRPAAIGGAQREGFDRLGDGAGYNGDGGRLFIDPGIPNLVSEYGAVNKGNPRDYLPYFGDLQNQPDYRWRSGQAIWCGFDYGTIAGKQGFRESSITFECRSGAGIGIAISTGTSRLPSGRSRAFQKLRLTADRPVIHGADATEDSQIVVTVLDAEGRHISNSPPVTLTLESGPGEFPTGAIIKFEPNSPVTIADGEAAIEFRSYYGGRSVIRASSPGLPDSRIVITTEGEPRYIPGVTPAVKARPYDPAAVANLQRVLPPSDVAPLRPTRASSEAPGHGPQFGNDYDHRTFWISPSPGESAWWQVDLEGFYSLSRMRVALGANCQQSYQVEISTDGSTWSPFLPGKIARYVRIFFPSAPGQGVASLAEVGALGTLSTQ